MLPYQQPSMQVHYVIYIPFKSLVFSSYIGLVVIKKFI